MNVLIRTMELGVYEWDWAHERLFMPEGSARGHKKKPFMHLIPFMNPVHTSVYDGPSFIRHYFADSYL